MRTISSPGPRSRAATWLVPPSCSGSRRKPGRRIFKVLFCWAPRRSPWGAKAGRDAARIGIRRAEQALVIDPNDGRALSLGAGALVEDGQTERALKWSKRVLELYPEDTSALVNVACVNAKAGQVSDALDILERVFAHGCGKRDWVEHDPDYLLLHKEPRVFIGLLGMLS